MKPVDINFNNLHRPDKPNYYLACPEGECNIKPDMTTPCYAENMSVLRQSIFDYIKQQPRYTLISNMPDQLQYVQRSLFLRFPDYVTFQFYDYENNKSSLAILSYAKYGYYDFGVNKDRVNSILEYLSKRSAKCNF